MMVQVTELHSLIPSEFVKNDFDTVYLFIKQRLWNADFQKLTAKEIHSIRL